MSSKKIANKQHYAVIAGLFASSASFFGKLSGDDAIEEITFLELGLQNSIWITRVICFILMLLCNALVWTFFVKALHSAGGTLIATVTSAATNYFISYILGVLVFGERITMLSIMGTSLILAGLVFLTRDSNFQKKNT